MIVKPDLFVRLPRRGVIVASGGFDPLHAGHVKYITEAKKINNGTLIVIVNGNGFLERKKGKFVFDEKERAFIVDNIKGVDYTIIWDDGTQYVNGAIEIIKPAFFAKGGDRSGDKEMPEIEVETAKKIGCKIIYGVGGFEKTNSSSKIMEKM